MRVPLRLGLLVLVVFWTGPSAARSWLSCEDQYGRSGPGDLFVGVVTGATPGTRSDPPRVRVAPESVVRGDPPAALESVWWAGMPPRPAGLDARARERARQWDATPVATPEPGQRLLLLGDRTPSGEYVVDAGCARHDGAEVEALLERIDLYARLMAQVSAEVHQERRAAEEADRTWERRADLPALFETATDVMIGERDGQHYGPDYHILSLGIARWLKRGVDYSPGPNEHYVRVRVAERERALIRRRLEVRGRAHQKILVFLREVPEEEWRSWGPFHDRRRFVLADSHNGILHATPERIAALGLEIADLPDLLKDPPPRSRGRSAIPDAVRRRADAYVISQVGEAYFRENYTWLPERSQAQPFARGIQYDVTYRYEPLRRIGAAPDKARVHVYVRDLGGLRAGGSVALLEEGRVREPRVTKGRALSLIASQAREPFEPEATRARLQLDNFLGRRTWFWQVEVHRPDPEKIDCTSVSRHNVDAVSGDHRELGRGPLCDGQ